jgi:hypothetical protein
MAVEDTKPAAAAAAEEEEEVSEEEEEGGAKGLALVFTVWGCELSPSVSMTD